MWCHFCDIFSVTSNSYVIIMMLCDSHKTMKIVTKFCIRIKRMDRSHSCLTDTDDVMYFPLQDKRIETVWLDFI